MKFLQYFIALLRGTAQRLGSASATTCGRGRPSLVSWQGKARTRREDELARMQAMGYGAEA